MSVRCLWLAGRLRKARELIEKESGAMEPDEIIRAVSRLLGYQRVGSDLSDAIKRAISKRDAG